LFFNEHAVIEALLAWVASFHIYPFGKCRHNNWNDTIEHATLGNTGLPVSKLCFGTMIFAEGKGLFKALVRQEK